MLQRTVTTQATFTERRVDILAVPFNQPVTVDDGAGRYREAFRPTTRVQLLRDPIPALLHHDPRRPFGVVEQLRRDTTGLHATLRASHGPTGDEALAHAADGVLYPSIGFSEIESVDRDGITWRTAIVLHEISLVTFQAYTGADVTSVRHQTAARPTPNRQLARLVLAGVQKGERP